MLQKPELIIWDVEWDVHLPSVKMVSGKWGVNQNVNAISVTLYKLLLRPELNSAVGTIQSI